MVTTQPETGTTDSIASEDTGTTFSKLRQLMTSTGNGEWINKFSLKKIFGKQTKLSSTPLGWSENY